MRNHLRLAFNVAGAAVLAVTLATCAPQPTTLQKVKARGTLRVLTLNGPTTYYIDPRGNPAGFDYDAAKRFANSLGVKLKLVVADNVDQILPRLNRGDADMAAAALAVTPARRERARFSPTLRTVTPELVYRRGDDKPASLTDVKGYVQVVRGSGAADLLRMLAPQNDALSWGVSAGAGTEDLLYKVAHGKLAYTVANSDMVAITQRYYPDLEAAFKLGPAQPLAWAFPRHSDDSLYNQAIQFVLHIRRDGTLKRLVDRYFSYVGRLNYVGRMAFLRDAKKVLPKFKDEFKKAATQYDLDWRLLAAMAYQESHWKPHARSPTGVKGIMMLTLNAADDVGIGNRLNPRQSILGGAQYLRRIMNRLPISIEQPSRTWMALAAYNVGFGHLMDARRLAKRKKENPNLWQNVRSVLPLLAKKAWYQKTRFGYARGYEAIDYVAHIRSYYDVLVWLTTHKKPPPGTRTAQKAKAGAAAKQAGAAKAKAETADAKAPAS